jgi:predicted dehydrogenase
MLVSEEEGMADPVRIGVIGCGRILPAHFRGLMRLREAGFDGFRVTGLVARNIEDAQRFRRRGEGPSPRPPVAKDPNDSLAAPHSYVSDWQPEEEATIFNSVEEMLASGTVDAVTITATLPVHHTAGLQALAAGKHVMVEKPLAVTVKAGRQMVDLAEQQRLTLGVMEMVRYQPATRMARWLIERGDLGEIQMVAAVSLSTGEWSPDRVVADTPWRHNRLTAGGGTSIDIGVHIAHRLRYLVGEVESMTAVARVFEPVRTVRDGDGNVFGTIRADADDAFFALPEFANGAAGTISFTWAGHGEPTALPGGLTIYGTAGCLKGGTLIRDDGTREEVADIFAREATDEDRERYFPGGVTDAFGLTYLDWLNAIESGSQPETSGADALRDLATAFAIMESATARHAVAVEDVLSGAVSAYQREIDEYYGL